MTASVSRRSLVAAALLLAGMGAAFASDTYISATVGGVVAPGVYGRIDIGNAPPPPVLYPQPLIIQRSVGVVYPAQPLYLYVPPGHAKNWGKHCARYNACGQPVYFVNVDSQGRYIGRPHDRYDDRQGERRRGDDDDQGRGGHDRGHGNGHGKGHGRRD